MTIPYERLGGEVYGSGLLGDVQVNAQDDLKNAQVKLDITQEKVLIFCREPRSLLEIAEYLGYKDGRSARKILNRLIDMGQLAMTIPNKPNSRNQKYISIQ